MSYHELSIEERATIQVGNLQGMGLRATARMLGRSPSTISREVRSNTVPGSTYQVAMAQGLMRQCRVVCRPAKKLLPDSELFELVVDLLRRYFSPEQIAGTRYALSKSIPSDCFRCETPRHHTYCDGVHQLDNLRCF